MRVGGKKRRGGRRVGSHQGEKREEEGREEERERERKRGYRGEALLLGERLLLPVSA